MSCNQFFDCPKLKLKLKLKQTKISHHHQQLLIPFEYYSIVTSDFLHILDANCSRITKRSGYCFKNQSTNASTNTNTNTNKQQFRESPEFTLSNVLDDIKQGIIAFLLIPK